MAESYRTGGGQYYDAQGGYVGGATYKFDQLGRIVGGIGPNGEQLGADGRIVGFDYSGTGANSTYNLNNARGLNPAAVSGVPASIAGAGSTGGGAGGAGDAKLEEQRRLAFGSLNQGANYFTSPLGQQTQNAIANTMSGADVPYTQGVQDRLFSAQADLNAGARGSQDDLIRRQLAERGMEGSGAGLAAMLGAGRDQSAANSTALSSIQNQAQIENFAARERARGQGESFLSSRSQAEAPYRLKEADLRSGMKSVNDVLGGALAGLLGGAPRNALGSPEAGSQMGLGIDGRNAARSTVGPGSGSNAGISVGNTPTQVPMVGGLGANQPNAQARQAQQGYQKVQGYQTDTSNFRQPGSSSGYVPRVAAPLSMNNYDPMRSPVWGL